MIKYTITQGNNGRIIQVNAKDLQSWALFCNDTPLQFKRIGGQAIAIVTDAIQVYHKPNIMTFHKEYMLQNSRLQWHSNTSPDVDMLVSGLLEFDCTI